MGQINEISNSTYGIHYDYSFVGEEFYSVSTHWTPGSRPILKIRIAKWKPYHSRTNCAIIYHDVTTVEEAKEILKSYSEFDFKSIEDEFKTMWNKDNFEDKGHFNSGETDKWWNDKFLPYIRNKINSLK